MILLIIMAVVVNNLQKFVRINQPQLISNTMLLLRIAGFQNFDLGMMLVDDEHIRCLNRDYRDVDEVTDVLAFPYHEILEQNAGKLPDVSEEERMLGDLVLGVSYILQESQRLGTDFKSDIMTHITHGMCHLAGYDHETQAQWSKMFSKELEILYKFNSQTGFSCKPLLSVGHYT